MIFPIPVYVEEEETFAIQPLFGDGPRVERASLERATAAFVGALRKQLAHLGDLGRHEELAARTFGPELREEWFRGRMDLRRVSGEVRFLVASFSGLDRRLAVIPALGGLCFEVARGETVLARAEEVVLATLRKQERDEELVALPAALRKERKLRAHVDTLEVEFTPPRKHKPRKDGTLEALLLGGAGVRSGAEELERVGRCLDSLGADGLGGALLRDAQVEEVERLLAEAEPASRRPVLLLGEPKAGKTAVLEEVVRRTARARQGRHASRRLTWLVSPQRLISGMSFVGQWEERLLAILKEARRKEHVLYVDDPVGLYHAGKSASSDLTVGQVLRPFVERGEVRLVVEATPAALRVLRELDRAFVDLMHVVRVEPTDHDATLRILLHVMRAQEARAGVRFAPDAIPTVLDTVRRLSGHAAMPGRAVEVIRALAARRRKEEVGREQVLAYFQETSGMSLHMLDPRRRFDQAALEEDLRSQVVGQPEALRLAADCVARTRARLEDPERPLGVFLFLGPTGVGKTESAKALARCMYGSVDRLVRLDMNQFVDAGAPARLVGAAHAPEGLLTGAVRRQPFSVLLLDEIEKAHPAVFDLLLQVLGEGRLSDARGRTADFTRTVIVMTSNLGVRAAGRAPGLVRDPGGAPRVFTREAEEFFRPEFFNRIDHVVPFAALGRDEITAVAGRLVREVLGREGLARRRTLLEVHPEALATAIEHGYDPLLGARALKRSLERNLAQPAAERLAVLAPGAPTLLRVDPGPGGIEVHVEALEDAPAAELAVDRLDLRHPEALAAGLRAAATRLEGLLGALFPEEFSTGGALDPRAVEAGQLKEELGSLRGPLEAMERRAGRPPGRPARVAPRAPRGGPAGATRFGARRLVVQDMLGALDGRAFLEELVARAPPPGSEPEQRARYLARELALLEVRVTELAAGARAPVHVRLRGYGDGGEACDAQAQGLRELFLSLGFWVSEVTARAGGERALRVEGAGARALAALEVGAHLHVDAAGRFRVVGVRLAGPDEAAGPGTLGPVLRLHEARGSVVDLRTRRVHRGGRLPVELHRQLLAELLPAPAELPLEVAP